MSKTNIYPVPDHFQQAWMTDDKYQSLYRYSLEKPEEFWSYKAEHYINWFRPWDTVYEGDFGKGDVTWFKGGQLNVSVNCIDRHLEKRADQVAILWEGDTPDEQKSYTYQQLHDEVCKLANALKQLGINRGDRVCIYMPMIPEAAFAMLACARIGAVHTVVFGGFSPHSLQDRILDCDCRAVITADEGIRGGKAIPLKTNVDEALQHCPGVKNVLVVKHSGSDINWVEGRDHWYHNLTADQPADCDPEIMDAEDPLFILYTSGSTGKPKGVLHSTAGYILYTTVTFHYVFDYQKGEVFWCGADVGWITGHSYMVYGPLSNGATTLMYAGLPFWPDASRIWEIVDRHQVNIAYTAPTAIRALMAKGNDYVENSSRSCLRLLGTVGEPINPEAWHWYYSVVGDNRCPIVDTWWQTETGGMMITPMPGAHGLKPGSAARPFLGIRPDLLDDEGNKIVGPGEGNLVISGSWPSQIRTLYGDHQRMLDTYFSRFPGYYCTGDGARRDEDGYYWITGRVDDVLNVSGHRLGTAEIESALVLHKAVAEAAVVGIPDPVKGEAIYAFVMPMDGMEPSSELESELIKLTASEIGPIAKPQRIQWTVALPKTRSGKIMRRILRKIAEGDTDNLGDTTTLADPSVVNHLIERSVSGQQNNS
ncbi:acetyl-CoA synthetase [Endozoicomonas montiporae]|uniref:Acetyl-coenzyme A synthetase n=2 Tax=Endozoicomonas montiporae TaxID=1027273 RepID=A0A081N1Z0_9GAMM|nr:acetate--CoA ligase [Endozoicomonas montiporae]AMO58586.1 acetyl-CoA synthetase [Endozoicomonas montiporae CL-33]KEQ12463.1 acetyl-CoA synthetase [Endozoicomonas montiporae]